MKDIFNKEILVGQLVATNYKGYTSDLVKCEVIGFTAQKVKLQLLKSKDIILKYPEQICIGA